jgi:ELWxxDGT repeat protein
MLMANDGDSGHEPWLTDGTAAGTHRAGDLCPGECGSAVSTPGEVGGWLVMVAGNQIWLSDGSRDGAFKATHLSTSIVTGAVPLPGRLLVSTSDPAFTPSLSALPITAPVPPPQSVWLESPRVPGFRFKVQIDGQTVGRQEPACMAQTLCVSGVQPGRSEVFVRVSGRPALVKLTTSAVDVWVLQTATGHLRHYRLNASDPAGSTLDGILDSQAFRVLGALEAVTGEAKKPRTPQPPGKWIEAKGAPGFRVQARLMSDGQSRILRKEPCMAETFCLGSGTAEVLVRVTGPKPNKYFWPMIARFTPATLEVWVQQRKTGKIRYYKLNAPPAGSSKLDGYFDRLGFKQ